MKFGIERLEEEVELQKALRGKRVSLLAHPASVNARLVHSIDVVANIPGISLVSAFGPQHGLRGDKQDNMVESDNFVDQTHQIPIHSLYGEVRRPTDEMFQDFDVILVDLQDLGCRIYTFITTLLYVLEAASAQKKSVWVLDRPNPIGRQIEGYKLRSGWESFVGAGPIPMRHGMTMGELARWFVDKNKIDVDLKIIEMRDWDPQAAPGFGWPSLERAWINPSPNAPNLSMARCYPGTVMLEGTTLSEGRGTTRPLELFGAPGIEAKKLVEKMLAIDPNISAGCHLRQCWFEPTFNKHAGELCEGIQIHVDNDAFYNPDHFNPWRLMAVAFKAIKTLSPSFDLWRSFAYEYEHDRLAIDLINGSPLLRDWVDDGESSAADLYEQVAIDEMEWKAERDPFLIY